MRKKCVRWTKSALIGTLAVAAVSAARTNTTIAQANNPATLPLVTADQLQYLGGFRLPATASNGEYFSYGGKTLAYYPGRNSLFVGNSRGLVAEVTIPGIVNTTNIDALPVASYLQGFADVTEGRLGDIDTDGVAVDSIMVYGDRLVGTAYIYYDARNNQRVSHFSHSLQLDQRSFSGWSQVWETGLSGFVAGMMSTVPAEWQSALGAPAVTGQCCIPIVSRTSVGPAAFGFDPARVGDRVVPATPFLYYTEDHATLGAWDGSNPTYGATTVMGGMTIIPGTRTVLYVGSNGVGEHCYGAATNDPARHRTYDEHGFLCYDPTTGDKGSHAYPYQYQVWAYDLNDFVAVRAGIKRPWEVVPYGVWPLNLPFPETTVRMGGVGYDAQRRILYMSQLRADQGGYAYRPIIHAFQVGGSTAPGSVVRSVTISADRTAPQPPHATVGFLAMPTGGTAPHQYRWTVFDGTSTRVLADWNTTNRYIWTPSAANPNYSVTVAIRSSGNSGHPEATASMTFPIAAETTPAPRDPATRVTTVTMSADRPAPQRVGTTIRFTAQPTGGAAPHQYKWFVYDGANWNVMAGWSTSGTFSWTPTVANAHYRVAVWARSAGSSIDYHEASAEAYFAIAASAAEPPHVTLVSLTADKTAPQPVGSTISFRAAATGGAAPLQYKWFVYDGTRWTTAASWSTANTFTWTPTTPNRNYRVAVWARSNGNAADNYEASTELGFAIETPTAPSPQVGAVTLSSDRVTPQPVNTSITWRAISTGGVAPHQYKWFVFDGSNWIVMANWSSSNTFTWRPTVAYPYYRIVVWVRSAGNTVDYHERAAETGYTIHP